MPSLCEFFTGPVIVLFTNALFYVAFTEIRHPNLTPCAWILKAPWALPLHFLLARWMGASHNDKNGEVSIFGLPVAAAGIILKSRCELY
jgi:hypothetical protein